jgi:hypothetical protein
MIEDYDEEAYDSHCELQVHSNAGTKVENECGADK